MLTATTALAAGNVLLRWSIGEALDSGKPGAYLPAVAALLLGVSQLLLYTRQMLSAEMREDIYRRIQRKILHSSMEALGKNDLGGISARYITDVGQIDGFVDRLLGKALPDLAGWLIAVGLLFWLDLLLGIAANGAFQRWLVSFRRLHDILDLEEEPLDGRDMGFELRAESGILARGVACRPGGHSVYEDLDLELGSRGLYVMSGESGKGKTRCSRGLSGTTFCGGPGRMTEKFWLCWRGWDWTDGFWGWKRGWIPMWSTEGLNFPAASANACFWPGPFWRIPPSICWTSPLREWTGSTAC